MCSVIFKAFVVGFPVVRVGHWVILGVEFKCYICLAYVSLYWKYCNMRATTCNILWLSDRNQFIV